MSFDPLSAAFDLGKSVIERVWPDPAQQAEELRKLEELRQKGELAELNAYVSLLSGQAAINQAEAAHPSAFIAGWRPAIGWTGAIALAYQYIIHPLLLWCWQVSAIFIDIPADLAPPPVIDAAALMPLILGMLGIGTMRSIDKRNRVDTRAIAARSGRGR